MPIPQHRMARGMDLKKSMLMGLDECHIALKEAYSDLSDEAFWRHAVPGRHNIATIVMHVLQQHDDFNGNLQHRLEKKAPIKAWHYMEHEVRFELWGLPADKLPKPGDTFPSVREVLRIHEAIHRAVVENIQEMSETDFVSSGVGQWPRLCDIFFRATYHTNAHIRQIWLIRGVMGLTDRWPEQHYA